MPQAASEPRRRTPKPSGWSDERFFPLDVSRGPGHAELYSGGVHAPSPPPGEKIRVVPLCYQLQLPTDGSQTTRYTDLHLPEIEEWGPYLTGITIHTRTVGRTTNHKWNVVLYWSLDGVDWETAVPLTSDITADGQVIHTQYTTATQLGLRIRLALAVENSAGSSVESAVVSAAAVFEFKT